MLKYVNAVDNSGIAPTFVKSTNDTHAMITKAATHQVAGTYQPTAIDAAKASVDFLIVDIAGVIDWKDGRREFVSAKQLKALKTSHTWMTNF